MRKWVSGGISLVIMALFAMLLTRVRPETATSLTTARTPTIWVLSDTHFIAPSLHDSGSAWQQIHDSAAGKDLDHQTVAIRALVHAALVAKPRPTAVVITGDLTFNGELASATSLNRRLQPLAKAGIHLLVLPGNHDIYDGWARAYHGAEQRPATQIGPADWRRVFAASYQAAYAEDPASLSYAVALNARVQLLMLDTNIYPVQPSSQAPNTGGALSTATLSWLQTRLKAAKANGQQTLVFMHHDLYAHDPHMQTGWVLNNAPALRRLLIRYQVPIDFAGHIHAQDILRPTGAGPVEVLSGSFTTSPAYYGELRVGDGHLTYQAHRLNVAPVLTAKEQRDPDLAHYQRYLKRTFKDANAGLMMQDVLMAKGMTDRKLLALSDVMTEMMWQFFAGRDDAAGAKRLQAMPGYRYLRAYPSLWRRFQARQLDRNLPDLHLDLPD